MFWFGTIFLNLLRNQLPKQMPVPAQYAIFPIINASLNGASTILLLLGRWFISRRRIAAHHFTMIAAVISSVLFLSSYLYYHFHVHSVPFQGTGWSRPVYYTILASHVILAIVIAPLVLVTLTRALRERFDRHRAIARWTFPLWLYVSITGVLVYFMLYHWFIA